MALYLESRVAIGPPLPMEEKGGMGGCMIRKVAVKPVCVYLSAMCDMIYHVKTAFKRDEVGFSGTSTGAIVPQDHDSRALVPLNYFNGLGQGSGGAPPAWQWTRVASAVPGVRPTCPLSLGKTAASHWWRPEAGQIILFKLYIPQHDGTDVPIEMIDVGVAKKTL
eukprot:scaffold107651_cov24-Cyclotella_meneghiniana.AAC.1